MVRFCSFSSSFFLFADSFWSSFGLAAAIRFFRACLKVNTHFMFRYLNKGDVFAPVLELVAFESPRDNMLSSACLELFEFMRKVGICSVIVLKASSALSARFETDASPFSFSPSPRAGEPQGHPRPPHAAPRRSNTLALYTSGAQGLLRRTRAEVGAEQ